MQQERFSRRGLPALILALVATVALMSSLAEGAPGDLLTTFTDPHGAQNDGFGGCVAGFADNVLIGAWATSGYEGAAYLCSQGGSPLTNFVVPGGSPYSDACFGHAIAPAGTNIVIGAYGANAAYLFDQSGSLLTTFTAPGGGANAFGYSVAAVGSDVLIGAFGANAAYLYDQTGRLLTTFTDPAGNADDQFGYSVAALGNNVLIGAISTNAGLGAGGAAYLYSQNGSLLRTFADPGGKINDLFGCAVAAAGTDILVGADGNTYAPGAAYLYDQSGVLLTKLTDPNGSRADLFGSSLAAVGSDVLVGAYGQQGFHGAAYLFDQSGTVLMNLADPAAGGAEDGFGYSVAAFGRDVLIGADGTSNGEGAAYLYQGMPTPEPSTITLFGSALLGLGLVYVRRRRARG
jgi:hypothetical protein